MPDKKVGGECRIAHSAATGWLYLEDSEGGAQFTSPARGPNDPPNSAGIKALDPETGRTMSDFKIFLGSLTNGLMPAGSLQAIELLIETGRVSES